MNPRANVLRCALLLTLLVALVARPLRADEVSRRGERRGQIDGGLALSLPAALPTGLMTGVGLGLTRGGSLAWGARASLASATEFAPSWNVHHTEVRMRATGTLHKRAGRGSFGLRLGAGATLVHETRTRNQGERAGLTGSDLETRATRLLPGVDLELAVSLWIAGAWSVALSGGPSLHLDHGSISPGWLGSLGAAWQF